jgi:hypothetical protein
LKRGAEKKSGIKKTKPGLKPILKTNKKIEKSKKQARQKNESQLISSQKAAPLAKRKKDRGLNKVDLHTNQLSSPTRERPEFMTQRTTHKREPHIKRLLTSNPRRVKNSI